MHCAEQPTLKEFRHEVEQWQSRKPPTQSLKRHLKQAFPGMTKEHFAELKKHLTVDS